MTMFQRPTTTHHPKLTMLKFLIPLTTLLVICSLADGSSSGGICFRKYNSEKGACKGRMSREFSASSDEPNSCGCGKHGQGYAIELKRLGKSKKWFECVPCPNQQSSSASSSSSSSSFSDPVAMSQVASLQEPQVDDPSLSIKGDQGIDGRGGRGAEGRGGEVWPQKRRNKGEKSEKKKIAFKAGKNEAKELFSIEDNSFKSPDVHDDEKNKAQVTDIKEGNDDVWSPWSDWGPCSKTCGDGLHQRTRFCLQDSCKEEDFQERPCDNLKPCVVDGQWSVYSDWSTCNVTCGEGYEERSRTCFSPAPANGGKDCEGERAENRKCQKELPCPVDGGWSDWSNWTTCSATCGEGFQTRSRQCNNPLPQHGGKPCEGIELESMPCVTRTNCAVDGNWTEWSKMDICSAKPCSGQPGYRTRFRSCTSPRPMFGGRPCKGRSWMREPCYNNDFCTDKVDGGWCVWKDWSECKKGIMKRIRSCECPPPANDGKRCEGDDFEEKTCGIILERQEELAATVKTSAYVTKREGCYDNEASGDGSDVNCDQEPEETATTEETGSGQQ